MFRTFGLLLALLSVATCRRSAAEYTGPVIDVHARISFPGDSTRALRGKLDTPEALREQMRLERLVALGAVVVAPRPGIETARALNDRLRQVVAGDPRLFAVGSVHPGDGAEALRELERINSLGFKMVHLHPNIQRLDLASPEVGAVVARAGELGLPVLLDFSGAVLAADIGPYLTLATANPRAQIVLAHMGATRFLDVLILRTLRDYQFYANNVWVELSTVAHMFADSPYEAQLTWVIRQVGVDRVLFGSGFPHRTPAEAIGDVTRLGLTADEQRRIFHDNAAALLGIAGGRTSPSR